MPLPRIIRVLFVCDDPLVCTALSLLFATTVDVQLAGKTANIAEIPDLCRATGSHILLLGGATRHCFVK